MYDVACRRDVNYLRTKAPFIWRKVVPGKRVTLLAESTLPRVYMRKKLTPLPEQELTTELTHALIVSP